MKPYLFAFIFYSVVCLQVSCSKEPFQIAPDLEGKIIYGNSQTQNYFIKDLITNEIVTCAGKGPPIISNSKNKLAFCKFGGLLITNIQGTEIIYENNQFIMPKSCLWSPDDNYLALFTFQSNLIEVLNLSTFKTIQIKLPNEVRTKNPITWTDTDEFIYFTSENSKNSENYISKMKFDGSSFQNVFKTNKQQRIGSSLDCYKPSGLILFTIYDSLSFESSICKIMTDGDVFQLIYSEITHNAEFFNGIKISPNGQDFAYYISGINFLTYINDISGKNKQPIWEKATNPQWSKDGRAIMVNYQYYIDWKSASNDIRLKGLKQRDKDAIVVENGPSLFYSWFFD